MIPRLFWLAAACSTLAVLAPRAAEAGVVYDVRVAGGGKLVTVSSTGQVVNLELWAQVTGAAGNGAVEGFQFGYGSLLSTDGGNIQGALAATLTAPFNGSGSQNGTPVNLDNDGDPDVGSNLTLQNQAFFMARAGSMATAGSPIANGQEFKLATLTFTVTNIVSLTDPAPISINFRVTDFTNPSQQEALWQEDGAAHDSIGGGGGTLPTVGTAVSLAAIPEPSSWLLLSGGLGGLLARRRRR